MDDMEVTRFRSFAERYVVERASTFRAEHEQADAWQAVQDAVNIYKNIHEVAERRFNVLGMEGEAQQQAPAPANPPSTYGGSARHLVGQGHSPLVAHQNQLREAYKKAVQSNDVHLARKIAISILGAPLPTP